MSLNEHVRFILPQTPKMQRIEIKNYMGVKAKLAIQSAFQFRFGDDWKRINFNLCLWCEVSFVKFSVKRMCDRKRLGIIENASGVRLEGKFFNYFFYRSIYMNLNRFWHYKIRFSSFSPHLFHHLMQIICEKLLKTFIIRDPKNEHIMEKI